MYKYDYLQAAIRAKCYLRRGWVTATVTKVLESTHDALKNAYPYRLVQQDQTYYYYDPKTQKLERIEDHREGALLGFNDTLKIDAGWLDSVHEPIETTFGRLLVNAAALCDVFGTKLPYFNERITVGKIESLVAPRLKDTPAEGEIRSPDAIYVDEYLKFVDRMHYLATLAPLCVYGATPKTITPPPGIREYREALVKEYGERLKDPAVYAEFEAKLKAYDDAYLKDDPTYGVFTAGKIKNIARKKLFLTTGNELTFQGSTTQPIVPSLSEDIPTTPEAYVSMFNGIRAGAFARGAQTVNGGVTAKSLLRALASYTITQEDCGAKLTLKRTFTEEDYKKLVDRYIVEDGVLTLVKDDAMARRYINRPVALRSPLYCLSEHDSFCRICVGEKLAKNPNGLALAVTDVSAVILATFMALMHGKVLSSTHFDYQKALT